jgi:hypothetical protein
MIRNTQFGVSKVHEMQILNYLQSYQRLEEIRKVLNRALRQSPHQSNKLATQKKTQNLLYTHSESMIGTQRKTFSNFI